MRVRIHRGAHEIGGNCVEVEHDGKRIVLDVGRPLTAARGEHVPLPDIAGLAQEDPDTLGVLITHHHADHWGLVDQVRAGLPIWMGEATHRILQAAAFWSWGLNTPTAGYLQHRQPFELGPFTVTPYLNDHSAYDAYSLLVQADDRRLFYTGDIRGHGRKASIFEQLIDDPPADVDVLLMEGTNLQPGLPDKPTITETELEARFIDHMRATDGITLVVTSAQNIDRLVTIYRATLQADRDLIMDAYTADIARSTRNPSIPRPSADWPRVRSYLPLWQARRIKRAEAFHRLDTINPQRIYPEQIADEPKKYVLLTTGNDVQALGNVDALAGATAVWSLWAGYLEDPPGTRFRALLDQHDIPLTHLHTSGHASLDDLHRLAQAVNADQLVPIHTLGADTFADHFDNVTTQPDGTWFRV